MASPLKIFIPSLRTLIGAPDIEPEVSSSSTHRHVDDFCKKFEGQWHKNLLKHEGIKRVRAKSLCLSEIMTIAITFHQNHYQQKP